MLQTQISSKFEDLDILNVVHPWIPNSQTCRSDHQTQVEKRALINATTPGDIVKWIFEGQKGWVFKPTQFKYNVPETTNHWILWNTEHTMEWNPDPQEINEIIYTLLYKQCANQLNFDFAWYPNPKPTVPQFYHVQVFWIRT
jgi:hypothetical protein